MVCLCVSWMVAFILFLFFFCSINGWCEACLLPCVSSCGLCVLVGDSRQGNALAMLLLPGA